MPETVPYQKTITIKKEPCDNRGNNYAKINLNALQQAMKTLSNAEFAIWVYFAKNQEGFTFALSPQAAADWGIARTTFNRTIRKFIEEGYLISDNNGSNHYTFYEVPKEKGTFRPYYGAPREVEIGRDFTF